MARGAARAAAARRVALKVLRDQRVRDARARDLLRTSDAVAALDERDRALTTRLVLGVVRTSGLLDQVINSHLSAKAGKGKAGKPHLEPRVRDALRIAAFELLYLSTPAEVAVSQGVELVRLTNHRAAGLGNAVLRRIAEEDVSARIAALDRLAEPSVADAMSGAPSVSADDIATVGALPQWFAQEALASCGAQTARELALFALEAPYASVATNFAKHTPAEARALLDAAGCEPTDGPEALDGCFVLDRQGRLAHSGLVEKVDVLPCDLAAQLVVKLVAPAPGSRVLEVGQGRGTKSVLLNNAALVAGGPCDIVAVEVDPGKSDLSRRRMKAAGIADHVTCVAFDARDLDPAHPAAAPADPVTAPTNPAPQLPAALDQAFDLVFIDAPCSGSGTLARHPEIAWHLTRTDVDALAHLQLQILNAAAARVAVGGTLAYATCSIFRQENEDVVEAFLAGEKGARFQLSSPLHRTDIPGADQHFLAKLTRVA